MQNYKPAIKSELEASIVTIPIYKTHEWQVWRKINTTSLRIHNCKCLTGSATAPDCYLIMPGKVRSLCCLPPQLCPVGASVRMAGEVHCCWLAFENIGDREVLVTWRLVSFGRRTSNNCGENQDD